MNDALPPPARAAREAAATRLARHPWLSRSANAVIGLALAGGAVCVPLLGAANARLRSELSLSNSNANTLAGTLSRNIQLASLAGNRLPASLATALSDAIGPALRRHSRGIVVMTYTSMVCTRALQDGLRSLGDTAALLERGIGVYGLIGQRTPRDREKAVLMRADGELPFDVAAVPVAEVAAVLIPPAADKTFEEEPLYLWLSPDLTIRSVFHGDQRRPALLDQWLATLR